MMCLVFCLVSCLPFVTVSFFCLFFSLSLILIAMVISRSTYGSLLVMRIVSCCREVHGPWAYYGQLTCSQVLIQSSPWAYEGCFSKYNTLRHVLLDMIVEIARPYFILPSTELFFPSSAVIAVSHIFLSFVSPPGYTAPFISLQRAKLCWALA